MNVAIYCRLSDEDRGKIAKNDESMSIQNQKTMLVQYAASKGWNLYDIYSDDDYTGADRNRPAFNRLIADAKAKKFEVVLCKTQSRFTREIELVEEYIHGLFPRLGIRFVSVVDNADTENRGNKKARQINAIVNEWFLEELSENIKAVKALHREQGLYTGPFAPYGYLKDPIQKGHLVIDSEAADTVREIFMLYKDGAGKRRIARILNDRQIPNPTEYRRLHGLQCKTAKLTEGFWGYSTIGEILTNQVYIGNMVQGKYMVPSYKMKKKKAVPETQWIRVEGTHEAIVSLELWTSVQARIKQRRKVE